jgi:hypothetical protein
MGFWLLQAAKKAAIIAESGAKTNEIVQIAQHAVPKGSFNRVTGSPILGTGTPETTTHNKNVQNQTTE